MSFAPITLAARFWHNLTRAPYKALPWVVFIYAFISCLVYTKNGPFAGHVVGFDDQVRMTQVLQWINGGGWYDRVITRVNAPEGFATIWARIVDIPIAAVILVAQIFTDQRTAALVASVVVPMVELAIMFWASRYCARPLAGKKEARLVLLFLMFTTVLNHKICTLAGFHPGEASHHAWYGILNVLMFGAGVRVVAGVAGWKPRLMLALAIALLLAVGIEGFPMIAGTVAVISILSWITGNAFLAKRGFHALGIASILSLVLLPIHVPPSHFFEVSFIQPSIIGPIILAAATLYLFVQTLVIGKTRNHVVSGTFMLLAAGIIGAALVFAFPDILNGATAGLSPHERELAQNEHPEVWSMYRVSTSLFLYSIAMTPLLLALAAGVAGIIGTKNKRRRMIYAAYTGFALVPMTLVQFYWRYIHHAESIMCPLLLRFWQYIRFRLPKDINYYFFSIFALVMLCPFWFLFFPALLSSAPLLTQVVFFPAKIYTEPYTCDTLSMAKYLNEHYGPDIRVNVPDWDSADFVYETDLKVDFLSNYPSHDHFIDNRTFFEGQDLAVARDIALRHQFDLVAACRKIPMPDSTAASRPYRDPTMIERLKEGIPPSWLKLVPTDIDSNYQLFAVDREALAKSSEGK